MWQRFTERARRIVFFAQEEAGRLGENYVSTEHVLLGLVRENDSVAAKILDRMDVSLGRIRSEIERQVTRGDGRLGQDMQFAPRAKRVIDLAYDEARQLSNNYIGTEHLLLGLIREGEGLAGRVLAKLGVELERVRSEIVILQGENDKDGQTQGSPMPPREPRITGVARQSPFAKLFARGFETLPAEQQTAMQGEGVPLNELPPDLGLIVDEMFPMVTRGSYVLDVRGPVRVGIVRVDGATHYTVTAKASFLVSFLATDTAANPTPTPDAAPTQTEPSAAEPSPETPEP